MHVLLRTLTLTTSAAVIAVSHIGCGDIAKGGEADHTSAAIQPISEWKLPSSLDFCGEAVPLNIPEVRERAEREFYVNLQTPGQIILYLKRSGRYFPMYERILKEEHAPADLQYLSVAESALIMSRSPKDAVGLWQFIPATAKQFGLIVNDYVDERRHPVKSTRAAIAYLRQGYEASGSWTNSAAGYNMGHASFQENMQYQGKKNFFDLYLNEETSRYILRIAVIKHIMTHAREYGIVVHDHDKYREESTRTISVSEAIPNLADWAAEHGTSYKDVKLLNPWIIARQLPAPPKGSTWDVVIPG